MYEILEVMISQCFIAQVDSSQKSKIKLQKSQLVKIHMLSPMGHERWPQKGQLTQNILNFESDDTRPLLYMAQVVIQPLCNRLRREEGLVPGVTPIYCSKQ